MKQQLINGLLNKTWTTPWTTRTPTRCSSTTEQQQRIAHCRWPPRTTTWTVSDVAGGLPAALTPRRHCAVHTVLVVSRSAVDVCVWQQLEDHQQQVYSEAQARLPQSSHIQPADISQQGANSYESHVNCEKHPGKAAVSSIRAALSSLAEQLLSVW